jgi:thiol-disulfide isomerase/thioredoxin
MRTPPVPYAVLALVAIVLGGSLISSPGKPSLAYRALRHFGIISLNRPDPPIPGRKLITQNASLEPIGTAPARLEREPGHAMLIDIFASWCPPCHDELAALSVASGKLKQAGIQLVGIDREESPGQVRALVADYHLSYPVYIDTGYDPSWASIPRVIPTTILVDKRGIVRYVHAGPLNAMQLLQLMKTV